MLVSAESIYSFLDLYKRGKKMSLQETQKMQKTIKGLQKQAAVRASKLALLLEEIFEDLPINVHYRIKSRESILKKCDRKNLSPENLTDILGIRLTAKTGSFQEILRRVFINFKVEEIEDFWFHTTELGYRSFHVLINVDNFIVELQIHTALSSAFALLCHDIYKNHSENEPAKDAVLLLRRTLEGEAQGVNGDHVALIKFKTKGLISEEVCADA
jgi:ppGpp synthetase/RelA/SpoT-type nucleotidyltranferase